MKSEDPRRDASAGDDPLSPPPKSGAPGGGAERECVNARYASDTDPNGASPAGTGAGPGGIGTEGASPEIPGSGSAITLPDPYRSRRSMALSADAARSASLNDEGLDPAS